MLSWFVPPIVVPAALALLIAVCAIYHAYFPSTPIQTVVVQIIAPQAGPLA
jgi:hypothetical protein